MKYLIVTTFPNQEWLSSLHFSTMSFMDCISQDVRLLVKITPDTLREEVEKQMITLVNREGTNGFKRVINIENTQSEEEKHFYERHKNYQRPNDDYRSNYIDFSHKIFALWDAYLFAKKENYEYIIWLDSDVVVHREITVSDLDSWINGADITYLGRKDWEHSECGFVAYKTENVKEFITKLYNMYLTDEVLQLAQQHDSFVFDHVRSLFPDLLYNNLSADIAGMEVFNKSVLGTKMKHFKGKAGKDELSRALKRLKSGEPNLGTVNVNDLRIKTKNCVDKEIIRKNISNNVRAIKYWYASCKKTDEVICLCSAGPSLDVELVKSYYDKGHKIVAVKHAIKPLQEYGIIPWAVILLDPRMHVADFVEDIHPDTIVFVASMVDMAVIDRLLARNLKVVGYHVAVGAKEEDFLRNGDCLIIGGSATATRGISILEGLGFHNMELFGYDCSYYEKPDLQATKEDGTFKYEEMTLEVEAWGGKKVRRTFWTEGQFLAQLQEFKSYYFNKPDLHLNFHGDGMIPWVWRNRRAHLQYLQQQEKESQLKALHLDDFLSRIPK